MVLREPDLMSKFLKEVSQGFIESSFRSSEERAR